MKLQTLRQIKDLKNKRVLLRVDFNVPVLSPTKASGKQNRASRLSGANIGIADDTKIRSALPTIEYLLSKGAEIVLVSHLGRPGIMQNAKCKMQNYNAKLKIIKKTNKQFSLLPIAKYLDRLIGRVKFFGEAIGSEQLKNNLKKIKVGTVAVLENVRFYDGEEKNDPKFAKELASLADVYVNDAFAVCHRAHASTAGVTKFLPSYAGLLLEKEIKALSGLLQKPKKPFVALMGGAKISDKIAVIENLSKKADKILLGGALVNNFFKAMGYEVGASLVESEGVKLAKSLLKSKKIILPVDVVIGKENGEGAKVVNVQLKTQNSKLKTTTKNVKLICDKPYAILDIGPKTILEYAKWLKKAKTLVWNGPMGLFEIKPYSHGTLALGRLFAARSKGKAFGVTGGGETLQALNQTGIGEYVDWISTGGGAMLEFLGGAKLPGVEVLIR
ncbi:MAG: phosphoglycerate kinase [bacterium]|nr:phosphoglycerate kinase [bacterium]